MRITNFEDILKILDKEVKVENTLGDFTTAEIVKELTKRFPCSIEVTVNE